MIAASEWNFARLTNNDCDIAKICLWEYGRECQSLRTQVERLRLAVAQSYGIKDDKKIALLAYRDIRLNKYGASRISDKKFALTASQPPLIGPAGLAYSKKLWRIIDEINQIIPRFNWGLFCSHEFPAMPWLERGSVCPIRKCHQIWAEDLGLFPHKRSMKVMKGGQITKNVVVKYLPYVAYAFADVIHEKDGLNANDVANEIAEALPGKREAGETETVHCFIIPDSDFELYKKEDLLSAVSLHFDRLDRRKIALPERGSFGATRDDVFVYLRNLGAMRLLHAYSSEVLKTLPARLSPEARNRLKLGEPRRYGDYRRKVPAIFREFFEVSAKEFPINWNRE